jgi:hypothetical protein
MLGLKIMVQKNKYGKEIRKITAGKGKGEAQKIVQALQKVVNQRNQQQGKPKRNRNRNRRKGKGQNQARVITDVPLGTSQKSGFNRNLQYKIIEKDEYIGEIAGTPDFTVTQFPVNIGQKSTFPWGSIEAQQWEKYEFLACEFYLKPEVTQFTANANSGKVILSFDSDATDAPPASKQEAEDIMPMADGMSYQTIQMNVPKFILNSHLDSFYVRTGNLPGGSDIKTYDLGNLFVSTMGQGAAVPNMMELRVRYTCKLMIPILESITAAPQNNSVSTFRDIQPAIPNFTGTRLMFTEPASANFAKTNGLNLSVIDGLILLPQGNYLIDVNMTANDTAPGINYATVDVEVNEIYQTTSPTFNDPSLLLTNVALSQSIFVSSDGTKNLSIFLFVGFSAGVASTDTTLRIVAV